MGVVKLRDVIQVRERGQITLPVLIRRRFDWLQPLSPVEIVVEGEELILRPVGSLRRAKKQTLKEGWSALKKGLEKIRILGDQDVNLSKFIVDDRRGH